MSKGSTIANSTFLTIFSPKVSSNVAATLVRVTVRFRVGVRFRVRVRFGVRVGVGVRVKLGSGFRVTKGVVEICGHLR